MIWQQYAMLLFPFLYLVFQRYLFFSLFLRKSTKNEVKVGKVSDGGGCNEGKKKLIGRGREGVKEGEYRGVKNFPMKSFVSGRKWKTPPFSLIMYYYQSDFKRSHSLLSYNGSSTTYYLCFHLLLIHICMTILIYSSILQSVYFFCLHLILCKFNKCFFFCILIFILRINCQCCYTFSKIRYLRYISLHYFQLSCYN